MRLLKALGTSFDNFLDCENVHPCFIVLCLLIATAALSSGIIFIVYGAGNIIEPILFGIAGFSSIIVCIAHARFVKRRANTPFNV